MSQGHVMGGSWALYRGISGDIDMGYAIWITLAETRKLNVVFILLICAARADIQNDEVVVASKGLPAYVRHQWRMFWLSAKGTRLLLQQGKSSWWCFGQASVTSHRVIPHSLDATGCVSVQATLPSLINSDG